MDASKLLNVLFDLYNDSVNGVVSTLLNTLVTKLSAGQTTDINSSLQVLQNELHKDVLSTYSPSNLEIARSIGASEFFGHNASEFIKDIFDDNAYDVNKTFSELQAYVKRRKDYIDLLEKTRENLKALNISPYYPTDDIYEVGLLLPKEGNQNTIISITKDLNQWDKIFKTLKELTGDSPEDTRIDYVSNGSLQFFIDHPAVVAACLSAIITGIVQIFKKVTEFQQVKEQLKTLKLNSAIKSVEKQEKQLVTDGINDLSTEIIKQFAVKKIEEERLNELKIAVNGQLKFIAKCINNGITIEINPPYLTPPDATEEDASDNEKEKAKELNNVYETRLKQIELITKAMDMVKAIGKPAVDTIKYLTDGDGTVENDDKKEDKEEG
jgi:hypothetical protein